jgi:hypothetical protein
MAPRPAARQAPCIIAVTQSDHVSIAALLRKRTSKRTSQQVRFVPKPAITPFAGDTERSELKRAFCSSLSES